MHLLELKLTIILQKLVFLQISKKYDNLFFELYLLVFKFNKVLFFNYQIKIGF